MGPQKQNKPALTPLNDSALTTHGDVKATPPTPAAPLTGPPEPPLIQTTKIVEPGTGQWFNTKHKEVGAALLTTLQIIVQLGEALEAKKAALGYGNWAPWVKANLDFDPRQANRYMTVARRKDEISQGESDLTSMKKILAALPPSENKQKPPTNKTVYVHKINIEFKGVSNFKEIATEIGMSEKDLQIEIDRAVIDRIEELRGKNDKS